MYKLVYQYLGSQSVWNRVFETRDEAVSYWNTLKPFLFWGSLGLTDKKVNWFDDEPQGASIGQYDI